MKRRVTTDTRPAEGHTVRDSWGRDGLLRRWLLPVTDVQRNGVRAEAGVRITEHASGTITIELVIKGRDA